MNKKQINLLLKYLKMEKFKNEKPSNINCEVCGSKKSKLLRKKFPGEKRFGYFPIHCCSQCGFIFQKKFTKKFYSQFYKTAYRELTSNNKKPPIKYLEDQLYRGKKLYNFLKNTYQKEVGW